MSVDDQLARAWTTVQNEVETFQEYVSSSVLGGVQHVAEWSEIIIRHILQSPYAPEFLKTKELAPTPPMSLLQFMRKWIDDHKAAVGIMLAGTGLVGMTILWHAETRPRHLRGRSRVSVSGDRRHIVVIAPPSESFWSRHLALDLVRRGFLVFVACATDVQEASVRSESKPNIRPIRLDPKAPAKSHQGVSMLSNYLEVPIERNREARQDAVLAGLVIIPEIVQPVGPLETIDYDTLSGAFTSNLIDPLAYVQILLPLIRMKRSRIILISPNIPPQIGPPFRVPSVAANAALSSAFLSLSRELAPLNIPAIHLRLGYFDFAIEEQQKHKATKVSMDDNPTTQSQQQLALRSARIPVKSEGTYKAGRGGSPLSNLHDAVFDALVAVQPRRVWHVGSGSMCYEWANRFLPERLTSWMLSQHQATNYETCFS